jgi:hypothetical protein
LKLLGRSRGILCRSFKSAALARPKALAGHVRARLLNTGRAHIMGSS